MQARLPPDKLEKAKSLVTTYADKRRITLQELQSLIGYLNFVCRVIFPGRPFLQCLINLTLGVSNQRFHISLNSQSRADLKAWSIFLHSFHGVSIFPEQTVSSSPFLKLYSDASGSLGFPNTQANGFWATDSLGLVSSFHSSLLPGRYPFLQNHLILLFALFNSFNSFNHPKAYQYQDSRLRIRPLFCSPTLNLYSIPISLLYLNFVCPVRFSRFKPHSFCIGTAISACAKDTLDIIIPCSGH